MVRALEACEAMLPLRMTHCILLVRQTMLPSRWNQPASQAREGLVRA